VPLQHLSQPPALHRNGIMPATLELVFDLSKLRPHPFLDGDTPHPEPPVAGSRTNMRETQKIKRFRLTRTPTLAIDDGTPPELDQPGLVRVQFQPELRESFAQLGKEPPRILLILKPDHNVISETDDDDVPIRIMTPPMIGPHRSNT